MAWSQLNPMRVLHYNGRTCKEFSQVVKNRGDLRLLSISAKNRRLPRVSIRMASREPIDQNGTLSWRFVSRQVCPGFCLYMSLKVRHWVGPPFRLKKTDYNRSPPPHCMYVRIITKQYPAGYVKELYHNQSMLGHSLKSLQAATLDPCRHATLLPVRVRQPTQSQLLAS
jgi:hypothetical protein